MRSIRTIMSAALLGCLLAACTATDGVEKRDAGTNPPAQIAEAASPGDGSPSTTEEGDVTSRRVVPGDPCLHSRDMNCRNRLNQLRDLKNQLTNQPTGLMVPAPPQVPPPPSNGGQCVIDITGQMNDTCHEPGDDHSDEHCLSPHGNSAMGSVGSSHARAGDRGKSVCDDLVDNRKRQQGSEKQLNGFKRPVA